MKPLVSLSRLHRRVFRERSVTRDPTEVSSFPFVSGDTFLQMAGWVFGKDDVIQRSGLGQALCFAPGPIAVRQDFVFRAEQFCQQENRLFTLIIHNGDQIPSEQALTQLEMVFRRVYCVNVVEESSRTRALPIGLENARLNHNGRLGHYLDGLMQPRTRERSRLVVCSFHPSNNPSIREPIAELFRRSRFGFDGHFWGRTEYREVLKDTCFVISPPGGGADCHRTWESIYMGAVPVVLAQHLAASLYTDMPILAVETYEEFIEMSDEELIDTYSSLVEREPSRAFASNWITELGQ